MLAHRVAQGFVDGFLYRAAAIAVPGSREYFRDAAEHGHPRNLVLLDPHETAGRYGANAAVERMRIRHVSPKEEAHVSCRVRSGVHMVSGQKGFNLGSRAKLHAIVGVIQRLDAVWIASEKQRLLTLIPQSERIHAP